MGGFILYTIDITSIVSATGRLMKRLATTEKSPDTWYCNSLVCNFLLFYLFLGQFYAWKCLFEILCNREDGCSDSAILLYHIIVMEWIFFQCEGETDTTTDTNSLFFIRAFMISLGLTAWFASPQETCILFFF